MGRQFKNVADLIKQVSEDDHFKKEALKHISENKLGKFLTFLRCQHNLTQKEMAHKLGCSQSRISKIESAKDDTLSIKDFIDYGNIFGLDLEIGFRKKGVRLVDMVTYHASQMIRYLNKIVQLAKDDKDLGEGVLQFCSKTLKEVPLLILNEIAKLPKSCFNKPISGIKETIHIADSIPIQSDKENYKEFAL